MKGFWVYVGGGVGRSCGAGCMVVKQLDYDCESKNNSKVLKYDKQ